MQLVTTIQLKKLKANGLNRKGDHHPVAKWFTPNANAVWLIREADPENP